MNPPLRMTGSLLPVIPVLTTETLLEQQNAADKVYVDPALIEFAVKLVNSSRDPKSVGLGDLGRYITYGASPRASINLILTARALAFVRGRNYVLPQDVLDMVLDVLRHRMVLSYEALSDGVSADTLLTKLLQRVPVPAVPLQEHVKVEENSHAEVRAN